MAPPIQKLREIVFQLLYSRGVNTGDWEPAQSLLMSYHTISKGTLKIAEEKVDAIWIVLPQIDAKIAEQSKEYAFERITGVELAILRLGLYELGHTDLPPKVAISEAIRLSKKFATVEGSGFVNALLDTIYQRDHAQPAEEQTAQ